MPQPTGLELAEMWRARYCVGGRQVWGELPPGGESRAGKESESMECLQEFSEHHKLNLNEQWEQDQFTSLTLIVNDHYLRTIGLFWLLAVWFSTNSFKSYSRTFGGDFLLPQGVSKMAFSHLIEFTYTAKLMIQGGGEANGVWEAPEFLQMLETI